MVKNIYRSDEGGKSELGWLSSRFSFNFAEYYNSKRNCFGKLLVLNDDIIGPGKGFGAHSHDNMEIITLVTKGELEHKDSIGNKEVLRVGEMQVMSAGRGITHSEYNHSKTKSLELFQIWIETARPEITPRHETKKVDLKDNELTKVVSGDKKDKLLFINQDAKISLGKFNIEEKMKYNLRKNKGLFVFVIEGNVEVDGEKLSRRDSIEITNNSEVEILTKPGLYLMVVEVPV